MQQTIFKRLTAQHAKSVFIFVISTAYFMAVSYYKGGLWNDELALIADVMLSPSIFNLIQEFQYEVHAPGVWFLAFVFSKLQLTTEFALRIPSAIMAGLGVCAFVNLASRYLNQFWLIVFWLLLLSLQPLTWHASEVRPHIFLFCFGSFILYFLHQAHISSEEKQFFKNIWCATFTFSISIWFHPAAFYLLFGAILPFLVINRSRLTHFNSYFSNWAKLLFLLNGLVGSGYAVFVIYWNLHSVLWNPYNMYDRFIQFTAASFGYLSPEKKFIVAFAGVGTVIFAALFKKISKDLLPLLYIYFWSLAVLLCLEQFGYPLSRTKYSLYLMPILTLVFVHFLSQLKNKKWVIIFPLGLIWINGSAGPYIARPKVREMISISRDHLKQDEQNKVLIFGDSRTLTYYLALFGQQSEQVIYCNHESECLAKVLAYTAPDKIMVYFYKTDVDRQLTHNYAFELIENDDTGRLAKVSEKKKSRNDAGQAY